MSSAPSRRWPLYENNKSSLISRWIRRLASKERQVTHALPSQIARDRKYVQRLTEKILERVQKDVEKELRQLEQDTNLRNRLEALDKLDDLCDRHLVQFRPTGDVERDMALLELHLIEKHTRDVEQRLAKVCTENEKRRQNIAELEQEAERDLQRCEKLLREAEIQ